ncbi:GTP-binding protein RAD-like isoform X2 [Artemia franciscana]
MSGQRAPSLRIDLASDTDLQSDRSDSSSLRFTNQGPQSRPVSWTGGRYESGSSIGYFPSIGISATCVSEEVMKRVTLDSNSDSDSSDRRSRKEKSKTSFRRAKESRKSIPYLDDKHNRSQSVKSTKNSNYLSPCNYSRPRGLSLPGSGGDDVYLLRHFAVTGKGVINRGDSFRSRTRSNTSVASTASSISTENITPSSTNAPSSRCSSVNEDIQRAPYRVLMIGATGVGKTALTRQFMTSEYLNTYETSFDDDAEEKSVSILLDGEESELTLYDFPFGTISVENCISTFNADAYVIVYSVVERGSFEYAEEVLQVLWRSDIVTKKAVIVVGNKIDLARTRVISNQEGKSLASSFDTKFIETSSGIQHNVDELLVGVLKQIRLKGERGSDDEETRLIRKKSSKKKRKSGCRRSGSFKIPGMQLLDKVLCHDAKSKSCEDLHVL